MSPGWILTLKIANQSTCMTLWLMVMHHHIKFPNKVVGDSEDEDINRANIH